MAEKLYNPSGLFEEMQKRGLTPSYGDFSLSDSDAAYFPDYNVLLSPEVGYLMGRPTMAHEVTHAYVANILQPAFYTIKEKKDKNKKLTKEEKQFLDNAPKLYPGIFYDYSDKEREKRKDYVKSKDALIGDRKVKDPRYRLSPDEIIAFGVGNTSVPGYRTQNEIDYNVGGHLDPTVATEISMLTEMYKALPEETKSYAASLRKNAIRKDLENSRTLSNVKEKIVDVFENPFLKPNVNPLLKD